MKIKIKDNGLRMYMSAKLRRYTANELAMASRMTLGIYSMKKGFDDQLAIMLNRLKGSSIRRFREITSRNLEKIHKSVRRTK